MAPNIPVGRIESETLVHSLRQHDSRESTEVIRDDKIENLDLRKIDPSPKEINEQIESVNKKSQGSEILTSIIDQPNLPVKNNTFVAPMATVPNHSGTGFQLQDTPIGKSLISLIGADNLPIRPQDSEFKIEKTIGQGASDPKESLKRTFVDTLSVAQEEQEWALVEKELAKELSFTKTLQEILQSVDNGKSFDTTGPSAIEINTQRSIPDFSPSGKLNYYYHTNSGSPIEVQSTDRPFYFKRVHVPVEASPQTLSASVPRNSQSPVLIQVRIPPSFAVETLSNFDRLPELPAVDEPDRLASSSNVGAPLINPSTTSNNNRDSAGPVRSVPDIIVSTPGGKLEDGFIRLISPVVQSRGSNPSGNKPLDPIRNLTTDDQIESVTEKILEEFGSEGNTESVYQGLISNTEPMYEASLGNGGNSGPIIEDFSTGGVLRIPGHDPESPADLDLVHHDLSLPFLEDQGAKAVRPNPPMTPEGEYKKQIQTVHMQYLLFMVWFI